jgi:hypothetical protein
MIFADHSLRSATRHGGRPMPAKRAVDHEAGGAPLRQRRSASTSATPRGSVIASPLRSTGINARFQPRT